MHVNDDYRPTSQILFSISGSSLRTQTFFAHVGTLQRVRKLNLDPATVRETIDPRKISYTITYQPDEKAYELARQGDGASLAKLADDFSQIGKIFERLK